MPLPTRRKGEEKSAFVSRCVSELSHKGEGKDVAQRVAICSTRADLSLEDNEIQVVEEMLKAYERQQKGNV